MDTTDWNPSVDKFLDVKFDADTVEEGKAIAKETLQAELGLPVRFSRCWNAQQMPLSTAVHDAEHGCELHHQLD